MIEFGFKTVSNRPRHNHFADEYHWDNYFVTCEIYGWIELDLLTFYTAFTTLKHLIALGLTAFFWDILKFYCGLFAISSTHRNLLLHFIRTSNTIKKHRSPPLRKLIKVTGVLINYLHLFKSLFMLAFLVHGKCPGILIFSCITVQVGALCKYLAGSATVVMVCVMNLLLHPLWIFYFSCFINGCLSREFWVFPYYALQYLF